MLLPISRQNVGTNTTANDHYTEKLNPGFTFILTFSQSTTTQPYIFLI